MQLSSVVKECISTGFYVGAAAGSAFGVITTSPAGAAIGFAAGTALIPIGFIYNTINHVPMNATNLLKLLASPYVYTQIGAECGTMIGGIAGGLFFGTVGAGAGYLVGKAIEPAAQARLGYR